MINFQDTFETRRRSFINAFSICMTVPLNLDTFYTLSHSSVSIVDFEHVNVCQNIDINFVEHSDGVYCVTFKNCIFLQGINQKITIGTVRPQLGKRASRCAL